MEREKGHEQCCEKICTTTHSLTLPLSVLKSFFSCNSLQITCRNPTETRENPWLCTTLHHLSIKLVNLLKRWWLLEKPVQTQNKLKRPRIEPKWEHLGHPEFNQRGILGLPKIQPKRKPLGHMNTQNSLNHRGKTQGYPEFNRSGNPWATQNSTKVGYQSFGSRRGGWTWLTFVNNPSTILLSNMQHKCTLVGIEQV